MSKKLVTSFCLVACFIAIVGGIGIVNIGKIGNAADIILDESVPLADAAMEGMISIITGRDLMGFNGDHAPLRENRPTCRIGQQRGFDGNHRCGSAR